MDFILFKNKKQQIYDIYIRIFLNNFFDLKGLYKNLHFFKKYYNIVNLIIKVNRFIIE